MGGRPHAPWNSPAHDDRGGTGDQNSSFTQILRQREITDVLHQPLAFFAPNPIQVSGRFTLVLGRVDVDVEVTPDRIFAAQDSLFARLDRRAAFILLHGKMLGALAI